VLIYIKLVSYNKPEISVFLVIFVKTVSEFISPRIDRRKIKEEIASHIVIIYIHHQSQILTAKT